MTDRQHLSYSYQTQSDTDSDDDNMSDISVDLDWGEDAAVEFLNEQAAAASISAGLEELSVPIVTCWKTGQVLCQMDMSFMDC